MEQNIPTQLSRLPGGKLSAIIGNRKANWSERMACICVCVCVCVCVCGCVCVCVCVSASSVGGYTYA